MHRPLVALFFLASLANAAAQCTFQRTDYPAAGAYGVLSRGSYIWVTNFSSGSTVSKLRTSDGTIADTFTVARNPASLAFDPVLPGEPETSGAA